MPATARQEGSSPAPSCVTSTPYKRIEIGMSQQGQHHRERILGKELLPP